MIEVLPPIVAEVEEVHVHAVDPPGALRVALAQEFADSLATIAHRGASIALLDQLEATRLLVIAEDVRSRTEAAWRNAGAR